MIIDFHTHAFPERIAQRALAELADEGGNMEMFGDGTAEGLYNLARANGVDACVVLNISTNTKQQTNVNNYAQSINGAFDGGIIAFGSVHPFAENALEEVDRIKAMGLKGIKLHPDYQDFYVDDPRVLPLYEKIGKEGLFTVFHSGMDFAKFEPVHCPPERLAKVLPYFGGSPVVAAHFGGDLAWYAVEEHLVGKDVYFDTSFCFARIPCLQAKRIVQNHGVARILFGTDAPYAQAKREMRLVDSLQLSAEDKALVMGGNARRLLGI